MPDKVLLVADVPNWAWMYKAKAIQKYLNDHFKKISVIHLKKFHKGLMGKYHTVLFFGWMDRRKIAGKYKGLIAGVSSHNFEYLHPEKARKYLPKYSAITANSILIYEKLKEWNLNKNIYYTPNGVDETIFYPNPIKHDKFRIGWMGQPSGKGFNRTDGIDMHGYHNVLLPLVESLKDEKDIEFDILARTHKNARAFDKMPEYYNNLDLFISTGFGIGTPNPLFEAQACGVAAISTAIGAAPELIENSLSGFLVPRYYNKKEAQDRAEEIREWILFFKKDRIYANDFGKRARHNIEKHWTWRECSKAYLPVLTNHRKKI